MQAAALVAPAAGEYLPAGHSVQVASPGAAKAPVGQHTAAPGGEPRPSPQASQASALPAPALTLAVPAGQGVQGAPAPAYVPAA